jgi:hypothetical protein
LRVRAAAFRTLKFALATDQTIEPTNVMGFNQFFDDFNGSKADVYASGFDARLTDDLYVGFELMQRDLHVPAFVDLDEHPLVVQDQRDRTAGIYLYQLLGQRWALNAGLIYDRFELGSPTTLAEQPKRIETLLAPLGARYFHPSGWFAEFGVTYLDQSVRWVYNVSDNQGSDSEFLVDAAFGFRFPNRRGLASIAVNNVFDRSFDYQDDNFRSSESRATRLIPEQVILGRVTLNF